MDKIKRILAVDPGSRYLGIAVMESGQLVYYGVKRIKTNQPARKRIEEAQRIIQKLIDFYRPQILVIEKPLSHWIEQSRLLNKTCEIIKNTAKENKVRVREITPGQIRKAICGNSRATKEEIIQMLILKYPDIGILLKQKNGDKRYWRYLINAVSLTMT